VAKSLRALTYPMSAGYTKKIISEVIIDFRAELIYF